MPSSDLSSLCKPRNPNLNCKIVQDALISHWRLPKFRLSKIHLDHCLGLCCNQKRMAGSACTNKVGLPSKSVQELAINKELPENYISKAVDDCGSTDASLPYMEIPVIDFGLLTSSSSGEELEKLQLTLSTWGCFQAINHGIPDTFLDKVHNTAKQFFALPMNEKQKYAGEDNDIEGYGNDMVLSDNQTLDWSDRVYLKVSPENERIIKFWPENPKEFREVLLDYTMKLQVITEVLLKAMARSLHLEDNCFLDEYGEQAVMYARFNCYPQCSRPDLVFGLKPHADGSAITIVLQDKEVEGLQFQKNNQWFRVPIIPQALLINVGDQIEIMTNGIFKSPVHRVVINSEKERISLAMFCAPDFDKEIEPVDTRQAN